MQAKAYEQERRQRKWNEKWRIDDHNVKRDWLEYDDEREHMFCKDCRKYSTSDFQKKGPFVIGTENFKLESIKEDEKSQSHLRCIHIAAAKRAPPNTTPAEKALCSLHQAQNEKMDKLFRTAHAIAKKGRPFTDFVWMCELPGNLWGT